MNPCIALVGLLLFTSINRGQERLTLVPQNSCPQARIMKAPLTVDREKRTYSLTVVVKNLSGHTITGIAFAYNFSGEIRGYLVQMNVQDLKREAQILPHDRNSFVLAEDAAMSTALRDMTTGSIAIARIEFDDGTVWERPPNETTEVPSRTEN